MESHLFSLVLCHGSLKQRKNANTEPQARGRRQTAVTDKMKVKWSMGKGQKSCEGTFWTALEIFVVCLQAKYHLCWNCLDRPLSRNWVS